MARSAVDSRSSTIVADIVSRHVPAMALRFGAEQTARAAQLKVTCLPRLTTCVLRRQRQAVGHLLCFGFDALGKRKNMQYQHVNGSTASLAFK